MAIRLVLFQSILELTVHFLQFRDKVDGGLQKDVLRIVLGNHVL
jgi:hypothetical protein